MSSSSWLNQVVPYSVSGDGIVSKTTLSSNGGRVNESVTKVDYEINYVTLSPGKTITIEAIGSNGYNSYPCAYMTLYY